ncbi:MAG: glycoside hydrolase family 127 protein [Bacteroidaceae bacterium]|nr:glycoside hydrolase family 127 protein [Bacteroidaceae bacterium]
MKRYITFMLAILASLSMSADGLAPVPFDAQLMQGSLDMRLRLNMQRLGEEKYQPDNVFLTMQQSGDWPGDTEGRTILALTLDAQALHSASPNLEEILRRLPAHLNERGYMGPVFPDIIHEQQLSGNGWMLRGLCEYYEWKHEAQILAMISRMARGLFLPWKGHFSSYPVRPEDRKQDVGAASGETVGQIGRWQLSSDVGCLFIGMDGLIHAYAVTRDEDLRPVIDELINCFLGIDLLAIKAQTHATLTALRGLLRYAALTGERRLVDEAAKRFQLYTEYGMAENFGNYNWFRRYDTWTEPCAIVDSYLLAVQLWQQTRNVAYLEWAEQIYFNALCHGQRQNGGFGCDNCPGRGSGTPNLKVNIPEAHWCCTMRGAEGLSNAARYSMQQSGDTLFFPFYRPATFKAGIGKQRVEVSEHTQYPFDGAVQFSLYMAKPCRMTLCFPHYAWMQDIEVQLNGKPAKAEECGGFLMLTRKFRQVDHIGIHFRLADRDLPLLNAENALPEARRRIQHGPLLMGRREGSDVMQPVWHLMDSTVWDTNDSGLRILFE